MNETKLTLYSADLSAQVPLPYAEAGIKAGFPSPAQDYLVESIDLNRELIRHKETTFYARVNGDSMIHAGIYDGDLAVIDKSIEPKSGDYVAAYIDGEFTLKEFQLDEKSGCGWLLPANEKYTPIRVTEENDFIIWGVITYTIKKLHKG
ncbi:MAG: LexA family protein [Phocaeicola sp.]